jgi:hypothetical protein
VGTIFDNRDKWVKRRIAIKTAPPDRMATSHFHQFDNRQLGADYIADWLAARQVKCR